MLPFFTKENYAPPVHNKADAEITARLAGMQLKSKRATYGRLNELYLKLTAYSVYLPSGTSMFNAGRVILAGPGVKKKNKKCNLQVAEHNILFL